MELMREHTEIASGAQLRFRAVPVDGVRKGLRLEEAYWDALAELATDLGVKPGQLISRYAAQYGENGNVTAAVRLGVLEGLREREMQRQATMSLQAIIGMVAGCPTAAFALSGGKKVLTYNPPFLSFLQARLSHLSPEALAAGLKLQLDIPFGALMSRLRNEPQTPVSAGYVIATNDRILRGRLNAVLANAVGEGAIIGYLAG
ncbi:ribbon-helix-helix domain-containing protein [Gellertiella hungarica]|uniref:Putative DNA-binding ribbon-helix-helix protein n=1 Tax=Gellertiella hungarica TaxID=1572859 RepID=A0A7W6NMN8_9HYPH|nr:ribbon-helix-helix domain-containing protein [Gellertiella hungarica]MBB4066562.1 putative DNA-binding ribbon-helix-helix protein [Gellertiella hungarica]